MSQSMGANQDQDQDEGDGSTISIHHHAAAHLATLFNGGQSLTSLLIGSNKSSSGGEKSSKSDNLSCNASKGSRDGSLQHVTRLSDLACL